MLSGYAADDLVARGFDAAEVAAGAEAPRVDALEAAAADRGDAQPVGDRRELPAAGGLLSIDAQ